MQGVFFSYICEMEYTLLLNRGSLLDNALEDLYRKQNGVVPAKITKCQSGRFLANYEDRDDVIANGDTESEAIENLGTLYESVIKHEQDAKR